MSKFLRLMTSLSKTPADYHKTPAQEPPETPKMSTVDSLSTVDRLTTVDMLTTVDKLAPPKSTAAMLVTIDQNQVSVSMCREATLVQHGHTPGEHAIYTALWNLAGPPDRRDDYREISIGYDRIATQVGGSKRNVQRVMECLQKKLALEIVREEISDIRQGKTYRVYGMAEILRRRRESGYTWVFRNRSAVELARMSTVANLSTVATLSTVDNVTTVDKLATDTVDSLSTGTVDSLSTPLGSTLGMKKESSSSAMCDQIGQALRAHLPVDDDAVQRLVVGCLQADPGATADEIRHFTELKIGQHRQMLNVKNPIGLLIGSVPKCFRGRLIEEYREEIRRRREQGREDARRTLDDPEATEQEKTWATEVLGQP